MEPAAAAWVPACNCAGEPAPWQLVEYYAASAAATHQHCYPMENNDEAAQESFEVVLHSMDPDCVCRDVQADFRDDIDSVKDKIHRYPESIRDLGDWYTAPRTVAIGPYHHNSRQQLKKAEQVKHVASCQCVTESGRSLQELYDAVVSAAADARRFYDKDAVAGISDEDFRHMMFFDACFLVQYMVCTSTSTTTVPSPTTEEAKADQWLAEFFYANSSGIDHDVWLLENQLPWKVVESVMNFRPVNLEKFVGKWIDSLHDRKDLKGKSFALDDSYDTPHLLGLLRHHIVGSRTKTSWKPKDKDQFKSLSISVSAIELAKIGITLTVNETGKLIDMGLDDRSFSAELSLAPLSLNYARASRLVNMAALEICCLTPTTLTYNIEESAVCSYLLLLSMLAQKEDDVHELRRHGVLEGGAGLTNKQVEEEDVGQGARVLVQAQEYHLQDLIRHCFLGYTYRPLTKIQVSLISAAAP
ncbi:hypothetical protein PVAP13_7NG045800 [Panicum virgatum]|uniref:Uncharacterized protein n=1 Tax=Panicum virgatum TaxID=38727 RepID=A0A8T0Q146_PANVG|nr:hypothetical protein PVAP13_7NG045800 [Panicum virgatum]